MASGFHILHVYLSFPSGIRAVKGLKSIANWPTFLLVIRADVTVMCD